MKLDIEQLLSEKGIYSKHLISTHQTGGGEDRVNTSHHPNNQPGSASNSLSLEVGLTVLQ